MAGTWAYGALLFSDNQALQSFGWLAISGEVACLLAALFVVPSLVRGRTAEAYALRRLDSRVGGSVTLDRDSGAGG